MVRQLEFKELICFKSAVAVRVGFNRNTAHRYTASSGTDAQHAGWNNMEGTERNHALWALWHSSALVLEEPIMERWA
jgi:hypothetical protein